MWLIMRGPKKKISTTVVNCSETLWCRVIGRNIKPGDPDSTHFK